MEAECFIDRHKEQHFTSKGCPIPDPVPWDSPGVREIGFEVPERYNGSEVLFQNLTPERAHRVAVRNPPAAITYAELCGQASRWKNALVSLGLSRGDRILFLIDDSPEFPAAFFGAVRGGFVPVLASPLSPPELLRFYIEDAAPEAAIVEGFVADRINGRFAPETIGHIIAIHRDPSRDGVTGVQQWLSGFSSVSAPADTHRNEMALWMYSSGSTGKPKAIVHLQHDIAYTAMSYGRHVLCLSSDDLFYSVPKMFFSYGFGNSITFPFSVGAASLVAAGKPAAANVLATIESQRPTVFFGIPTLYAALLQSDEFCRTDLSSLRLAVSAAEPMPPELADAWQAATGIEIIDCLGATELLNVILSNTPAVKKRGSIGRRVPGYEIVLKDTKGNEVEDGKIGVMWVRGHSSTPMYWKRPEQSRKTIREDGWIRTNDLMTRDKDGFYFYIGRSDDLVKISGQFVHPGEVQRCLSAHPLVRECAVLPVDVKGGRALLKAFVVARSAVECPDAAVRGLQDHVKRHLSPYKYPRVVQFTNELPRTGTGKLDRQALLRLEDT